ncbi:Two-component response regulator SSK1p, variant 2 [Stygiomarasmius scandens]|uniref:Two-component response regulator SSK1p, variant 2 n=1 Tax=Marasmiellus scandens TaxID=2682957 RepID=A0ABR1K2B4_9AGAR
MSSVPDTAGHGECLGQGQVAVNAASTSKVFIRPGESSRSNTTSASTLSSDSGETDTSGDESGNERERTDSFDPNHSPPITRLRPAIPESSLPQPRFSRAFSLPLPSQLGHLQHPHRASPKPFSDPPPPGPSQLRELSLELADSVQMAVQTMLQIAPAQVLDPAKESFSACSLAVPTSSMTAMLTAMKNLNYISANMSAFCEDPSDGEREDALLAPWNDFDVGELLQSVGDALSGTAAQAGVELVLYHGDVGMKHVWLKGDESGLSYLLSHLLRQILATSHRGDTIEIGLLVSPTSKRRQNSMASEVEEDSFRVSPVELEGPLRCTIEISHRFAPKPFEIELNTVASRPHIIIGSLLRRLLNKVGATYSDNTTNVEAGHTYQLQFILDAGISPLEVPVIPTLDAKHDIAREPSLDQLTTFIESLKGKKVHLYASSKGKFAHHLTSYLTAWGMDVSHISAEGVENLPELPPSPSTSNIEGYTPTGIPAKTEPRQPKALPPSFVFIDDDVSVLKERLDLIRSEYLFPANPSFRNKRPSLAVNHRPRSSPQVNRLTQPSISSPGSVPAVILHFTSLSNFKIVRDLIQSFLASRGYMAPLPEIMIIPKPAGPRRFLTALHTAFTKPIVDPFFAPIATSPITPNVWGGNNYFHTNTSPRMPSVHHRPTSSRSSSDHSITDGREQPPINFPPSPLSSHETAEYFQSLGSSPSSGYVVQSVDGSQGIFFHPKPRGDPSSSTAADKDKGHFNLGPRKSSLSSTVTPGSMEHTAQMVHLAAYDLTRPPLMLNPTSTPSRPGSRVSLSHRGSDSGPKPGSGSNTRRPSAELAPKVTSPVSPPPRSPAAELNTPPIARAPVRRPTQDPKSSSATPTNKKGKSPAEGNIVPPISVLIVDDNPINRTILSTFMKKKRIKFDVAQNGKQAVEKWQSGEFHLILMDIQMPVMDGIAATRAIRQMEQANAGYMQPTPSADRTAVLASTPSETSSEARTASPYRSSVIIVALTASSLQSDRIAALGAGCNDFLTKPVSLEWLNNKLIEWGSIKALQMYADPLADVSRKQTDRARDVAEKLHVPKGRSTPPSPVNKSPVQTPLASGTTAGVGTSSGAPSSGKSAPASATSSAFWSPGQPSAANTTFWNHLGIASPDSGSQQSAGAVNGDAEPPEADSSVPTVKSAGAEIGKVGYNVDTPTGPPRMV